MDRSVTVYSAPRKQAKIAGATQPQSQDIAPTMPVRLVVLRPGRSSPPLYRTLALPPTGVVVMGAPLTRAGERAATSASWRGSCRPRAWRNRCARREARGALTVLDGDIIRASGARTPAGLPHRFSRGEDLTCRSSRVFGNFERCAHPRWIFNGGVTAEGASYSGTLLAPRAAVNYHMTDSHTVRASWSHAHRRPTPFERHSDTRLHLVDDAQRFLLRQTFQPFHIKPERITVRELGYIAELPRWNLSADLRVFEERIERLVRVDGQPGSLRPPPLQRAHASDQFFSGGKATIRGTEPAVIWRPRLGRS